MNNCKTCGKETKNKKYCSYVCFNIGHTKVKTIKNCKSCGCIMELQPCFSHKIFCSYKCREDDIEYKTSKSKRSIEQMSIKENRDNISKHNSTHGMRNTKTYLSWLSARSRTRNKKDNKYSKYGAKGITMYEPWFNSFELFYEYIGERPIGMTLDRINGNGNYEPGNVRWATPQQQAENKKSAKPVVRLYDKKIYPTTASAIRDNPDFLENMKWHCMHKKTKFIFIEDYTSLPCE